MSREERSDGGFVLVDALVALTIFAGAAGLIYETGLQLLFRANSDLDRLSATTALHTEAKLLQARGIAAESLVPSEDRLFRYVFVSPPTQESDPDGTPRGFFRAELSARDKTSSSEIAVLQVGFDE